MDSTTQWTHTAKIHMKHKFILLGPFIEVHKSNHIIFEAIKTKLGNSNRIRVEHDQEKKYQL